jgi:hypothetical protein
LKALSVDAERAFCFKAVFGKTALKQKAEKGGASRVFPRNTRLS